MAFQPVNFLARLLPTGTGHYGQTSIKTRFCVLFAGLLLCTVGFIYYQNGSLGTMEKFVKFKLTGNGLIKQKQYPACPIPQLEPFHESIQDLVNYKEFPSDFYCEINGHPLLFNSTLHSTIIPAKGPDYFREQGYESCCYRTVARVEPELNADFSEMYTISSQCFPVNLTSETKIPDGHEFIAIFCEHNGSEVLVDVHAFVHLKPSPTNGSSNTAQMEEKFNVVIFGMDAMSRMNFLRTMPQSYSFLKNEMGAVEMFGYNKVGEGTMSNMMPMLMSGIPQESQLLEESGRLVVDDWPLIWKEYSKQGYYTMFSEDDADVSLFNSHDMVFRRQPTTYYVRPLSHFANVNFHSRTCYGPRLTYQFLLDYMETYVDRMSRNRKNFFQFTWTTAMTHDYMNGAVLGDPHLLNSLRWLKGSGHLKNTIFILMSGHGSRLDVIRSRVQGQLEDRLPFMYFVFPESFKNKYPLAYKNLFRNADKLITTYDLHESLKDILNLDRIEGKKLWKRGDTLLNYERNLRGISLFLPVPEFRTCEMAGIDMMFCSCNLSQMVNVSDPEINVVAKIAVGHINSILGQVSNNSLCSYLNLYNVSMAHRVVLSVDSWRKTGYMINFETTPGDAQYEAIVGKDIYEVNGNWTVQGPVVRTNRYGSQSHCVQDIKLKPYCYCLG